MLGVSGETLEIHGAVSQQTAEEMAQEVRRLMNADIGLSDTGVAGPSGGTPQKPVGLFYIGISSSLGTRAVRHVFGGDRLENKEAAARAALGMLKEHLLGLGR